MLLGAFNSSLWDDGGGLKNGEVVRAKDLVLRTKNNDIIRPF
jgi:hypothetical protein